MLDHATPTVENGPPGCFNAKSLKICDDSAQISLRVEGADSQKTYTYSVWGQLADSPDHFDTAIDAEDAMGRPKGSMFGSATPTTEWQVVSIMLKPEAGADHLFLAINQGFQSQSCFYVNQVWLGAQ